MCVGKGKEREVEVLGDGLVDRWGTGWEDGERECGAGEIMSCSKKT